MKAFIITLQGHEYSETVAQRCQQTAAEHGVLAEIWYGVDVLIAESVMNREGLKWTWAQNNTQTTICPETGLKQVPYKANDLRAKIGCSMSHYLLWKACSEQDETFLILEHDAVFVRDMPDIDFNGICQINDPTGATWKGRKWAEKMHRRNKEGVFPKTWMTPWWNRKFPDGLAGNSAYLLKPWAAKELVNKTMQLGVWPNDALMCKQLFPYLEEYYPFITKAKQTMSTSNG